VEDAALRVRDVSQRESDLDQQLSIERETVRQRDLRIEDQRSENFDLKTDLEKVKITMN